MKKLSFVLLSAMALTASAQTIEPSQKLTEAGISVMGKSVEEVMLMNFMANRMCVVEHNPEKAAVLADFTKGYTVMSLQEAETVTSATFNPFKYGLQPLPNQHQYFRLGDTGKTLFVYSKSRVDLMYEREVLNNK